MSRAERTRPPRFRPASPITPVALGSLIAVLALLMMIAPSAASAEEVADPDGELVEPATIVAELESELMCPVCGTLLGLADAPQAHRQRAMIIRMVEQGHTKQEIKDAMVDEFGSEVLPMPEPSGFSVSAYIVPIAGIPVAAILLAFALLRWRRQNSLERERDAETPEGSSPSEGPASLDAEDERRLDADLDRYDL